MAREDGFAGLILEGTAADIAKVGRNFVPAIAKPHVRLRVDPELSRFENLAYTVAARVLVLLVSSRKDRMVTAANMLAFAEALAERGVTVELLSVAGGHALALRQHET